MSRLGGLEYVDTLGRVVMANQYVNTKKELPVDAQLLRILREAREWSQLELAEARGISEALVSHLENGRRPFKKVTLSSLAASMGFGEAEVGMQRQRLEARICERKSEELVDLGLSAVSLARRCAVDFGLRAARSFEALLEGAFLKEDVRVERKESEQAFQRLCRLSPIERKFLVETHPDFQTLAIVERLCLASETEASRDHRNCAGLARLALASADRLRLPEEIRNRARGYAWIFVGNALRIEGAFSEADKAFERASRLWHTGKAGNGLVLEEWRLPDGKAVLRRDQRRWSESLDLHDQALVLAPTSAKGRILVSKAAALEPMGEAEKALEVLGQAGPLIEGGRDLGLLFAWRINFAINLTHVGRLDEAERMLTIARKLALDLNLDRYLVNCLWVSGRIAGERGKLVDAVLVLRQVRQSFGTRQLPLEAASAAMDESIYLLQAGEFAKVATLSEEVAWVFGSKGVGEEALKALRIFCEAAYQRVATVAMAREVQERLRSSS